MKQVKRKPIENAFLKNQLSERHFERLGTRNPTCSRCGECDPICLTGTQPEIACYECQAQSNGKPVIEPSVPISLETLSSNSLMSRAKEVFNVSRLVITIEARESVTYQG